MSIHILFTHTNAINLFSQLLEDQLNTHPSGSTPQQLTNMNISALNNRVILRFVN